MILKEFRKKISLLCKRIEVQSLQSRSRPRRFPQEFQARFNARIVLETIDGNPRVQAVPIVFVEQSNEDGFKRFAV